METHADVLVGKGEGSNSSLLPGEVGFQGQPIQTQRCHSLSGMPVKHTFTHDVLKVVICSSFFSFDVSALSHSDFLVFKKN